MAPNVFYDRFDEADPAPRPSRRVLLGFAATSVTTLLTRRAFGDVGSKGVDLTLAVPLVDHDVSVSGEKVHSFQVPWEP